MLFDNASKETVPPETLGKISSWFGPEFNSNTRLGFLDIAVVSRQSQKALVLVEIEETTDKPRVLLGYIRTMNLKTMNLPAEANRLINRAL